ncbi:DENN domain-containing protein 1A isoform X2 [Toxorhynchites rutilus septentrionalis]|uniref:DENN domain-containing protein 1A isoform X2 n=1 Tax=Toxorhynchites rutilus septentrionalis TaxID=329112 RepID=UPI002479E4F1|nr:DENN domain-containing protein 1A isoform X2 [Toxorhynchites rutilus septentrionalis]
MNSRIKEDVNRLFEYWCEIAPETASSPSDPSVGGSGSADRSPGYIVQSFPESFKDAKVIADIPAFAFPCAFERRTIQVHSFVLTNIDSKWRFGFCRHDPKTPTAMVIVTYLPWHDTFIRFLNVLADVRRNSQSEFESFLAEAYNKGIPEPGGCLKLQYDRPVQTFCFQRPQQFLLPSIPENHNLNLYYNFVEPKFMIGIFAAMLAERRIIFVSRRLDILASCIQAANAFLYPMVWQHIFIPVLPMKMKDILGAPMPFLIGVPEAVFETLRREEIGEVVILNCDKRTLETPFEDVKNMPPELVASLKKHLANSAEHRGDRVSKIFLGILVQLIGGYRDAVKFNDKITFDPETFIDTRPSHLRPFLTNMLQLQIFQQFIEERLDMLNTGQGFSDEFEVECFRYAEKSGRKVKQYKDLLKNFKDKVKEGGKGMKTAYKGLRSKFRETTPPKTKLDSSIHSHMSQYDVGHQSAPNSPVFNKRPQTIVLPDDSSYHSHAQMLTPSSTSLYSSPHIMMSKSSHNNYNTITGCSTTSTGTGIMNNNFNSLSNNSNNNHHYNNSSSGDIRSPSLSLSPTSSNSSSEMNLLQELQHLALFKSPAVNRNLKPGYSLDATNRPSSRTGAPLSPPGSNQLLPRIQETPTASSAQPLLRLDLNTSRNGSLEENGQTGYHAANNYNNNDHNFDLSPDMPCPPVPPRRFQTAAEALAAIQITPPPMSPPSSSSSTSASPYRNYNFLQQAAMMQNRTNQTPNPNATGSPPPPSGVSQLPPLPSPPPPPPPLKASRNDPLLTQFDDDELITLTPNNSTNASSQIVLEPSSTDQSIRSHGGGVSNSISMQPNYASQSHTLPHCHPLSSHHHNNHSSHQKPPAPQPPQQRPPLAPKPTFRKESNVDVADANTASCIPPTTKPGASPAKSTSTPTSEHDKFQDLINLDTTNSSFELEDFDPLNENARPIPASSVVPCALTTAATTPNNTSSNIPGASPPARSPPTMALGINNPIYPYFTPTHLHHKSASQLSSSFNANVSTALQNYHHAHHQHSLSQGGGGKHIGPGGNISTKLTPNSVQNDFELLRNYGLDKFSLLDSASISNDKQQHHHTASLLSNNTTQPQGNINSNGSTSDKGSNNSFNKFGNVNTLVNGRSSNASNNESGPRAFRNWTTFD